VSTSIALVDRAVTARMGGPPSSTDSPGAITLDVAGNVSIDALAAGAIAPTAVAGSTKSSKFGDNPSDSLDSFFNGEFVSVDRIGVGASGAVALAFVDDSVTATVDHTGTMQATAPATLRTTATNSSWLLANAGALMTRQVGGLDKASVGLSGAVAVISATSRVEAALRRATIDGFTLEVSARHARVIEAFALSGAGGKVGDRGSITVNFAGSGAAHRLTTTTLASIDSTSSISNT
jgi:hypothetical protein